MTTTINASPTNGIVQTADGSGVIKLQSNGVATNALAWVNFNGTGTVAIRSSYNVSSITDNGTGDYTVNFTTALSDANYAALATATNRGGGSAPSVNYAIGYGSASTASTNGTYSTSALQVYAQGSGGTAVDVPAISVAIFGN